MKTKPNELNLDPEENDTTTTSATPADIFADVAALGVSPDELIPSQKVLTVLPVRKPKRDEWVRCHTTLAATLNLYEDGEERATYLVTPAALEAMGDLIKRVRLVLAVNYSGQFFAWPVAIPADVRANAWHASAFAAAEVAARSWVRVSAGNGQYDVHKRIANDGKLPEWPAEIPDVPTMLRFAFGKPGGGEVIDSTEHPVVQRLLGMA
ncbi:MAG: hypothetical protein MUC40_00365 [Akkermansiaceae bacterium]|jgi:hypothetical protein|nr:hypothetical protein [Akkermansiaceae bacterium]